MSFRFLQPLHSFILDRAKPIHIGNAHKLLLPLAPLGLEAFLLRYNGTQLYRVALAGVTIVLMLDAWSGLRFVRELKSECTKACKAQLYRVLRWRIRIWVEGVG